MSDKGGIVAVNGIRRIEQHRFKVLFDVADFGGILFHAVKDKFNVAAVELHKLCLDKLCRVIVPGDTDCLSLAAYRFKDNRNNFRPDGLCLPARSVQNGRTRYCP